MPSPPKIVGMIETTVWHLEMFEPPNGPAVQPPDASLEIVRAQNPSVRFFRFLYDNVGGDWLWCDLRRRTDKDLARELAQPSRDLRVLWSNGVPQGFAEIDFREPDDVELLCFGLMPEAIGSGYGRYFLDWMIRHVFASGAKRFWVHTCDLDHPRAKSVYESCGFRLFDQESHRQIVLENMPIPQHAIDRSITPVD